MTRSRSRTPAQSSEAPASRPSGTAATSEIAEPEGLGRERRWSALLELLGARGRLTVSEARRELGASEATIRRDFAALAHQQLATRTHGGVVATSVAYELPQRYRMAGEDSAKERIARKAASLVEVGSVVGINGGTTTTLVARHLAQRPDLAASTLRTPLTVVTNALNIASEMVLRPYVRCVTVGGVARPVSYEVVGPLANLVLEQLWLDIVIIGVDALDASVGATCSHDAEAAVNGLMVRRSSHVVVVATGDKVGRRSFARICAAAEIQTVVTDARAEPALGSLRDAGITIILA